jgi:tetratricopeptide (TPR) repeat protein
MPPGSRYPVRSWGIRLMPLIFLMVARPAMARPESPSCSAGETALEQGRLRQARARYEACVESSPTSADLMALAEVYSRQADYSRAIQAYRRAIAFDPHDPNVYLKLGVVLMKAQRYADAIPELGRAIVLNPGYAQAHVWLAMCLFQLKEYELAAIEAKRARRVLPQDTTADFILGSCYLNMGFYDGAVPLLQQALKATGSAEIRVVLGEAYLGLHQSALALRQFTEAARTNPRITGLNSEIAAAYSNLGNRQMALSYYRKALNEDPKDFAANDYMARRNRLEGQFTKAAAYLARAERAAPDDPQVLLEAAELAVHNRDNAKAEHLLRKVLERSPDDIPARILLSQLYFRSGQTAQAKREQAMVTALQRLQDRRQTNAAGANGKGPLSGTPSDQPRRLGSGPPDLR